MSSPAPFGLRLVPAGFVLLWSTGWVVAGLAVPYAQPLTFLAVRFALAGLLVAGLAIAARAPWPSQPGHVAVTGILLHAFYLGAVYWAVAHGLPAGLSGLLAALQPILTALLAPVLVGEVIGPRRWAGVLAGLAGLALVLWPRLQGVQLAQAAAWPIAINVAGMVSVTLGTFYQKRFVPGGDLRTLTAVQYAAAFAVVAVLALATEDLRITWNGPVLFAMAWSVLALSIGAVVLLLLLIRRGAVSRAAILIYLVPPAAALQTWIVLGEALSPVQLAGMVVVVLGVVLATRRD